MANGARGHARFRDEHFFINFQIFNLLPYGTVINTIMSSLR